MLGAGQRLLAPRGGPVDAHRSSGRDGAAHPVRGGLSVADLDYAALGFRCGLEIHQQVDGGKLFCRCHANAPRELDDEHPDFRFERRLRPAQSEMGELDAAALVEARRAKTFEYRGFHRWSCLVDADEEPPHRADEAALDAALTMAL